MHIFNESPYFVSPHLLCFIFVRLTRSVWDYFNCHFFILMFASCKLLQSCIPLNSNICLLFSCCLLLDIFSLVPHPRRWIHTASIRSVAKTPIKIDRSNKWGKRCDAVTGKMCWRLKEQVMSSLQKQRECGLRERERRGIDPDFVRFEVWMCSWLKF